MKPLLSAEQLIGRLKAEAKEENRTGMVRFGIPADKALGVPKSRLSIVQGETGRDKVVEIG